MISKKFHWMVNHQSKVNFHWWVHVKFSYSLEFDLILMMCSTRILCTQLSLKHIHSIKYSFIFSFAATLWLHYPSIITVSSNMINDHTQTNDAKRTIALLYVYIVLFSSFFSLHGIVIGFNLSRLMFKHLIFGMRIEQFV